MTAHFVNMVILQPSSRDAQPRSPDDWAALSRAVGLERRDRLVLEERGRAAIRTWNMLERACETAGKAYNRTAQREIGGCMERFAQDLNRDQQFDNVLRERGRELGIARSRGWTGWCRHERSIAH
jgi:hypothetical protein